MDKIPKKRLEEILPGFTSSRVMVLGDLMLDHFLWGTVTRISPEAPVPVVEVNDETIRLGGAGNVAHNIRTLGATPVLVGLVGNDQHGHTLVQAIGDEGVDTGGIVTDVDRSTTVKTRVVAHSQQVVRADREDAREVAGKAFQQILEKVEGQLNDVQALIISDYGKGVITAKILSRILPLAKEKGKFVAVDPKESHFPMYRGVSLITPNQKEASQAYGRPITDGASLQDVVKLNTYVANIVEYRERTLELRREYFRQDFPAATLVEVKSLARPEFMVEIEAVAAVG